MRRRFARVSFGRVSVVVAMVTVITSVIGEFIWLM